MNGEFGSSTCRLGGAELGMLSRFPLKACASASSGSELRLSVKNVESAFFRNLKGLRTENHAVFWYNMVKIINMRAGLILGLW